MLTAEFANQARRGLRVFSHEYIRAYESYCKGLLLHQSGQIYEALIHYSQSLTMGGAQSQNKMRLRALQAIELIIREKVELEDIRRQQKSLNLVEPRVWSKCSSIYKWLSHHYIRRRSVVFIVDSQFDSVVYRDKAIKFVNDFYSQSLNSLDYFGFISLDASQQASRDEIMLELRDANMCTKRALLRDIAQRDVNYVFGSAGESSKSIRLESALEKAYQWQNTLVPNFEVTRHNKVYVGPHKWIVCLLGDDVYSIN